MGSKSRPATPLPAMSSVAEPSLADPSLHGVSETLLLEVVSTKTLLPEEGPEILPPTIPTVYEADAKVDPVQDLVKCKWPRVKAPPAREGLRYGPPSSYLRRPTHAYLIYGILRRTPEHRLMASDITELYKKWRGIPPADKKIHEMIRRRLRKSKLFYNLKENMTQGYWTISTPELHNLDQKRFAVDKWKRETCDMEEHVLESTAESAKKITATREQYPGLDNQQLTVMLKTKLKIAEDDYNGALKDCEAELDYVKKYPHVSPGALASEGIQTSLDQSEAVESRTTTPDESSQPQLSSLERR